MSKAEFQLVASKRGRRWYWFRLGLLCILVLAIGFWQLARLRQTIGKQQCRRELQFFSEALMNYLTSQGRLPPAYLMDTSGRRMHSWRSVLIPFVDTDEWRGGGHDYKFDEPWDSPANTWFRNETSFHEYYACPVYCEGSRNASYLCVVGGDVWPAPKTRGKDWNVRGSPRWREGGVLPSRGKDILLVEVIESDVPWTKPGDISRSEIAGLLREDATGNLFRRRIRNVVVVDAKGILQILDPVRDLEEIRAIIDQF